MNEKVWGCILRKKEGRLREGGWWVLNHKILCWFWLLLTTFNKELLLKVNCKVGIIFFSSPGAYFLSGQFTSYCKDILIKLLQTSQKIFPSVGDWEGEGWGHNDANGLYYIRSLILSPRKKRRNFSLFICVKIFLHFIDLFYLFAGFIFL